MLDAESQEVAKLNKLALTSIIECIIYCGKQGISFRGHRDNVTDDTSKKGNFITLLQFRAQTDASSSQFYRT